MAVGPEQFQSMVDAIYDMFSNEETSQEYGEDPNGWCDSNLPEGCEPGDVAQCMPEVGARMGGEFQERMARYNATCGETGTPVTTTVVNECSYNYNTCHGGGYFAECPPNVTVINVHVTVVEAHWEESWHCEYPPGWEEYPTNGETPETIDDYVVTDEGEDGPPITAYDDDYPTEDGEDGENGTELPTDDYPADGPEPPGTPRRSSRPRTHSPIAGGRTRCKGVDATSTMST